MSEYWKSTPRYWCKHCSLFVRDTKLDRTNHEATGKHKGAVARALRDLHRNHEKEEREKDRAKREIERLAGVVSGNNTTNSSTTTGNKPHGSQPATNTAAAAEKVTKEQRQAQLEQLAVLGVNIPDDLRADMAMAGEWTVTKTRVIEDDEDGKPTEVEAKATGVRKRELEKSEEQKDEEDAVKGLFKKQRRWGRDSRSGAGARAGAGADDAELDALLSGTIVTKKEKKEKKEEEDGGDEDRSRRQDVKTADYPAGDDSEAAGGGEAVRAPEPSVKKEEGDNTDEPQDSAAGKKTQPDRTGPRGLVGDADDDGGGADVPLAVVFKKRKPKNIRQKECTRRSFAD